MKAASRLLIAQAESEHRSSKFIMKFLIRRGIDVPRYMCPSTLILKKLRCQLKDFRHVGGGGVGVVKSCSNCRYNSDTSLYQCRSSTIPGDANKLIVVPFIERDRTPKAVTILSEIITIPDHTPCEKRTYVFDQTD